MNLEESLKFLHGMASVRRYSQTKLVNEESVLEHTGFVGILSYFIGMDLQKKGQDVDMSRLFAKAMAHDMEEVIVGDIPRPTKYFSKEIKNALKIAEQDAINIISNNIDSGNIEMDWLSAKSGIEGNIVAVADLIAVVYKAWQEIHIFGNKAMAEHIRGLKTHIKELMKEEKGFATNDMDIDNILQDALKLLIELEKEL